MSDEPKVETKPAAPKESPKAKAMAIKDRLAGLPKPLRDLESSLAAALAHYEAKVAKAKREHGLPVHHGVFEAALQELHRAHGGVAAALQALEAFKAKHETACQVHPEAGAEVSA